MAHPILLFPSPICIFLTQHKTIGSNENIFHYKNLQALTTDPLPLYTFKIYDTNKEYSIIIRLNMTK